MTNDAQPRRIDIRNFGDAVKEWRDSQRGSRAIAEISLRVARFKHGTTRVNARSVATCTRDECARFELRWPSAHVFVAPDGSLWTGRPWRAPAAPMARGQNVFVFGLLQFAASGPPFTDGDQFEALAYAIAVMQDVFSLHVDTIRCVGEDSPFSPAREGPVGIAKLVNAVRRRRDLHVYDRVLDRFPKPPATSTRDRASRLRDWVSKEIPDMTEPSPQPPQTETPRGSPRAIALTPQSLADLRPHVIELYGGQFSQSEMFGTSQHDVERIFADDLPRWVARSYAGHALPIVLHAHGGLDNLAAGLAIAAEQVPWWLKNGCYPIQFVWRTGFFDEIVKILHAFGGARGFDLGDVAFEKFARALQIDKIWAQMKSDAEDAFAAGGAGSIALQHLIDFARAHEGKVELHAVGHSAGSIFHGRLLQRLHALNGPAIETLTFLAPAISIADYEGLVDPLVPEQAKRVRIFSMKKDFERSDTVGGVYRKSLLYLVFHALEPKLDEPILGLQECFESASALNRRFAATPDGRKLGETIWSRTATETGAHASQAISHGGFHTDAPTMNSVARGILGISDTTQLSMSFPSEAVSRALDAIAVANPAAKSAPFKTAAASVAQSSGRKPRRALCVGIDAYPAPNALGGCVADMEAWAAALRKLDFQVDILSDAAATHQIIAGKLDEMIRTSVPGDVLAFQYSGHGALWSSSEGKVAMCPVDFEDGGLLVDDDIRAMCDRLPSGVSLTFFVDSCHSYSIARMLMGPGSAQALGNDADRSLPKPQDGRSKARYVRLTPEVRKKCEAKRMQLAATTMNAARDINRRQEDLRWVAFTACTQDEYAYETDGRGDFSRIAVPLLEQGSFTNEQFKEAISNRFGAHPRQNPRIDCAASYRSLALLSGARPQASAEAGIGGIVTRAATSNRADDVANLLEALARVIRS